jgi:hypothetical protein
MASLLRSHGARQLSKFLQRTAADITSKVFQELPSASFFTPAVASYPATTSNKLSHRPQILLQMPALCPFEKGMLMKRFAEPSSDVN